MLIRSFKISKVSHLPLKWSYIPVKPLRISPGRCFSLVNSGSLGSGELPWSKAHSEALNSQSLVLKENKLWTGRNHYFSRRSWSYGKTDVKSRVFKGGEAPNPVNMFLYMRMKQYKCMGLFVYSSCLR